MISMKIASADVSLSAEGSKCINHPEVKGYHHIEGQGDLCEACYFEEKKKEAQPLVIDDIDFLA